MKKFASFFIGKEAIVMFKSNNFSIYTEYKDAYFRI